MDPSRPASGPSRLAALARGLFSPQFIRYLAVGVWNTVFGYACFALFTALLDRAIPQSYLAAIVLSNIVSITVAFFCYKTFVFKTRGNYFREWCRCFGVYSGSTILGLLLLPLLVFGIRHNFGLQQEAPYIAGALLTVITPIVSFFGHKHISFRPETAPRGRTAA